MLLRILYVGQLWEGGTCRMRMVALRELGHEVVPVDTAPSQVRERSGSFLRRVRNRLIGPADLAGAGAAITAELVRQDIDILWLDKVFALRPGTLKHVRSLSPGIVIASYNPDDPFGSGTHGWRNFKGCIPLVDIHFVPRAVNVAEYQAAGAKRVERFFFAYDRHVHKPIRLEEEARSALGNDVCFVGTFERPRAEMLLHLATNGVSLGIWGGGWRKRMARGLKGFLRGGPVWGEDYAKVLSAAKMCLGFLMRRNRDLHTTRTFEIPACGAFMLAERTDEHLELFEEGKEAEFFSSDGELLDKTRYYLEHDDERKRIAAAGRERCLRSGYSYHDRMREMLRTVEGLR